MRRLLFVAVFLLTGVGLVLSQGFKEVKTLLVGYEEVPAISTAANGEFHARISRDDTEISYELSYSDLEGAVQQSHIHFGQQGVNGGIVVFLCSNLGNGPPGTQPCPPPPATITGTLSASDMVGTATAQGIAVGDFSELIQAIRAGKAYVNVHSAKFPGGEVRGQLGPGKSRSHHSE